MDFNRYVKNNLKEPVVLNKDQIKLSNMDKFFKVIILTMIFVYRHYKIYYVMNVMETQDWNLNKDCVKVIVKIYIINVLIICLNLVINIK